MPASSPPRVRGTSTKSEIGHSASSSAPSRVTRTTFEDNVYAIDIRGHLFVDQVKFVGNGTAIFGGPSAVGAQVFISNALVTGANGLVFIGSPANVHVSSSTFSNTYAPLYASAASSIRDSIID